MAGMSSDLGRDVPGSEKLYARELWADFSLPHSVVSDSQREWLRCPAIWSGMSRWTNSKSSPVVVNSFDRPEDLWFPEDL